MSSTIGARPATTPFRRPLIGFAMGVCLGTPVLAQSLYEIEHEVRTDENGIMDPSLPLKGYSFHYIEAVKPKTFAMHDLVTIIIDEVSSTKSEQTLETNKEYDLSGSVPSFPSLRHLLELQVQNGDSHSTPEWNVGHSSDFTGEGTQERKDRFTARITAEVIDVKPNGNLVLQASKQIVRDDDIQTIVVTGTCRTDDVTRENTILSSQLASFKAKLEHEGSLRKSSKKGIISEVLDAIFAF
ncbi:MAG: flagellar basal body L-ring protein FlgH [Phycisphaerales bacterium]|nr:flagellar basal body L-ring protein FlgH [Phycisphaerales bacterium]